MNKLLVSALAAASLCTAVSASAGTQAQTKNPIVLVPGIFAFDTIAGIDYWYKIPSALQSEGATVHVPKINAFDSSAKRGEALIAQLEQIRAASGGSVKKFNLIGHSQGGITSRYVMNVRPDLVASVTTLHTPHKGSPLADVVTGIAPAGTLQGVAFDVFANAVGDLVNLLSNNKKSQSDIRAMLAEFNKTGAAANNSKFPTGVPTTSCGEGPETASIGGNSVRMYSWSGTAPLTNVLDISDPLFTITSLAFSESNDGVTGRCSSHFGKVLKDNYTMNHLDPTNQVLGLVSLFETNPKTLYQNQANRLKNLGL
ncbi:alpha/beta fold hydrolase [Pseudomonas sp. R-28-1W-6]|jgi:triacylglycerol lipase|uniref:lipase family alpha/beta hydrolase n=1 Tax=Pseudomonas sp. R-28-1W-6 TaxID=2650101 RepID=UPI0013663001|nr:triacylglycerol lipase [Pseudomonas sp. R-28-1W-6]MWV12492.1 alpha/beta fold hydrolase [Pseudomonas sp. R-28-1W-6]